MPDKLTLNVWGVSVAAEGTLPVMLGFVLAIVALAVLVRDRS